MARDDLFTVVHEQFITDTAKYADIVLPATTQIEATDVVHVVGTPVDRLERGRDRAARRGGAATASCFAGSPARWGSTEPSLFDDDMTVLRAGVAHASTSTNCAATGWLRVPYPEDGPPVRRRRVPDRRRARSSSPATASSRWASRALPDVRAAASRVPTATASSRALPLAAADTEAPHPIPELGLLATCPSTARPRAARSSRSTRPTPHRAGLADGDLADVFNDRASVEVPVKVTDRLRPGVVAIPFGWWTAHHPDGKVANSLTNDTLTDWGGGVAYSDTLVEVATRPDRRSASRVLASTSARAETTV